MPALLGVTLTGFSGYASLLTVAPLWAVRGGADEAGAGLVNGILLLFTVLTQLFVPGALARWGWGPVMAVGLLLMGLPSLAHLSSDALGPTLALSAVRGVGFGILTVTGSAGVAELVDPARRGAAIGAYGLAIALPNLGLLALSAWVAQVWGFAVVFVAGALPLAGVPAALALGRAVRRSSRARADSSAQEGSEATTASEPTPMGRRTAYRHLVRPTVLLLGVTLAGGALITFAPQMVDSEPAVAAALLAMGATGALARWRMGALADRHGAARFLLPLVLTTTVSMGLLAWSVSVPTPSVWVLVGFVVAAGLLGVSYGGLQNLTLVLAFDAVPRRLYGLASAVWNVGFDLGTGLGSVLVGLVAAGYGFPQALLVTAGCAAATLPLAVRRVVRRRTVQ